MGSSFSLIPVVVALIGHMMNSVILGLIFAVVISRITRNVATLAIVGMMHGAVVFFLMWFLVLPLIDPAMLLVNSIGFILSHLIYGLTLGVGIAVSDTRPARLAAALRFPQPAARSRLAGRPIRFV